MGSSTIERNSKKLAEVEALVLRHLGIPGYMALSSRHQESLLLFYLWFEG